MEAIIYENNGVKQEITKDELIIMLRDRISKAIEYIREKNDYILKDDKFLDHDERIDRKQILRILDILEGEDKE